MGTDSQQRIRLVAGLGNPGPDYVATRHNVGFMVVDRLLARLRGRFAVRTSQGAQIWEGNCRGAKLLIVKPLGYMNLSGGPVAKVARSADIAPCEILVVHDDMDLPPGRIRIRGNGSSGGHNGVESVMAELESADFARVRVGIGRGQCPDQTGHVLSAFEEEEKEIFDRSLDMAADAVKLVLYRGLATAMNEYNGKGRASGIKED